MRSIVVTMPVILGECSSLCECMHLVLANWTHAISTLQRAQTSVASFLGSRPAHVNHWLYCYVFTNNLCLTPVLHQMTPPLNPMPSVNH